MTEAFDQRRMTVSGVDLTFHGMSGFRRLIALAATCIILANAAEVWAQTVLLRQTPDSGLLEARVQEAGLYPISPILVERTSPADDDEAAEARTFRRRQAILITGVAVSMLAYGLFTLQFNNRRTDAEEARLAYQSDVRENAQYYVDEGIPLDEIPTYDAWVAAYNDASSARERLSIAGLSAFLLGIGAILDSATAGRRHSGSSQDAAISPVIGVSPGAGEVLLGARVGF